ncbi:MAG: ABC transporter ATP-binding protein [Pseudomonadota bacterium]
MSQPLIHLQNLKFGWPGNSEPLLICKDFRIDCGEHLFIRGASGSGKSTLLNLIAAVMVAPQGQLSVCNENLSAMSARKRDQFRADHIGFIFQQFNLVPYLNLVENILLPCRFSNLREQKASQQFGNAENAACFLMKQLFPNDHLDPLSPVANLSVGQQQRIAAARALIGNPDIVIADEPTSSLDADSRERFINLLFEQAESAGSTLLFVSHDPALGQRFERIVDIEVFRSGANP